ncbi:hypothetical protein [Conexibacter sp. CPCC 206217]|uniref:hypothetical protein n=1 Tax=Conexibacter sp. CPCC 206217 TaxID=3064574 RepID=UPI00271B798B|nr:hypothetical protein [Conexibacter sp. CPCC 206217]MDO8208953.1 hypothetical protein [Conexibacter sp. CPCC 206217]
MSTLGDIATIAAPTIVAVSAIGASTWQQASSRSFDRAEREKERQHERRLQELDDQRELLDEIASALDRATMALAVATGAMVEDAVSQKAISDAETKSTTELQRLVTRLSYRFGEEHEVVAVLRDLQLTMFCATDATGKLLAQKRTMEETRRVLTRCISKLHRSTRRFRDAGYRVINDLPALPYQSEWPPVPASSSETNEASAARITSLAAGAAEPEAE